MALFMLPQQRKEALEFLDQIIAENELNDKCLLAQRQSTGSINRRLRFNSLKGNHSQRSN